MADGDGSTPVCLLCYEEDGADEAKPMTCCGKEVCGRCTRMLQRCVGSQALLCPFCRCPNSGLCGTAAVFRGRVVAELRASRSPAEALRRIVVLVMLAPSLSSALEETSEGLVHFAASYREDAWGHKASLAIAAAVACRLCREWPKTVGFIDKALRQFWDDLSFTGSLLSREVSPVADFAAEMVGQNAFPPLQLLSIVTLHHNVTSDMQGRFACTLLQKLQETIGQPRLKGALFDDAYEDSLCVGLFPVDGHPANVAYVRKLFENSGLAWLCDHDSFQSLALLSDSDSD